MRRILLLFSVIFMGLVPPAHAAPAISMSLQSVSPAYLTAVVPVSIGLNLVAETDTATNVSLWLSSAPLVGRSQVQEARNGDLSVAFEQVQSRDVQLVNGGNGLSFLLPATVFRGLKSGVYAIDIRVNGGDGLQVLLPIWREGTVGQLSVVTLMQLNATPTKVGANTFTDDAGVAQYESSGNLAAILQGAAAEPHVAWLLDPDVVVTAQALANGGTVVNPARHDVSSGASEGAASWLDALVAATEDNPVYLSNYAGADVGGLVTHGLRGVAQAAIRQTAEARDLLQRADVATAVVARSGDFSDETWKWLASQPVYLTVLSSSRWQAESTDYTPTAVVSDPNDELALVADRQASRELTLTMRADETTTINRQSLFADLLITALERPNESRVLVMMPRAITSDLDAIATAQALQALHLPWVEAITPSEAISGGAGDGRVRLDEAIGSAVNSRYATSIRKFDQRRRALGAMIGDTVHNRALTASELRIASSLFTRRTERFTMRSNSFGELGIIERSVRIVSSGSVMFPGESGVVPITIFNDLDIEVSVKLSAVGIPAVRVQPEPVDTIVIGPGKRKSIEIPTKLVGADTAFVELQLLTTDDRKLGKTVAIEVASSAYSRVAAFFVAGAFALLLMLIVINTVRRVRVRRHGLKSAGDA